MSTPRDQQVICRECKAVLGRYLGKQAKQLPRLVLLPNVALLVAADRVDLFCPACGHARGVDLTRYQVAREKAA